MRQPARPDLWEASVWKPPGPTRQVCDGNGCRSPRSSTLVFAGQLGIRTLAVDSVAEAGGMQFRVELEQEDDGRWIAEVPELPGVMSYGATPQDAQAKVQALALRVVADRLEHGEEGPDLVNISFNAA